MIYGRELPGYPYDLKAMSTRCIVWGQRLVFGQWLSFVSGHSSLSPDFSGQAANDLIRGMLEADRSCLIGRFGSGEMEAVLRGLDVAASGNAVVKFLRMCLGKSGPFWWDNSIRAGVVWNAGVFPESDEALNRFAIRFSEDSRQLDVLACWLAGECRLKHSHFPGVKAIPLNDLRPYVFSNPWTSALSGKRVLVVHPSIDTIRLQYSKRKLLFKDPLTLPDFKLIPYRAVNSALGQKVPFASWFEALEKMCGDISKIDFDVALIGAGAYGLPVGAFIKRELRRKAVHLGGISQLLFGIKGKRWDDVAAREGLYNEHWIRPLESDRPKNFETVEGGCYW